MWGAALTLTSFYVAAGVLVPLLVVYKEQWHFSSTYLTMAFAVYAIGFLAALLTLGSLSDHVGRRPVVVGALLLQLASIVVFLFAANIEWVMAARVAQGIATGAASTALTASLVDLAQPGRRGLATVLGSASVTGGLALGSIVAGGAIQWTSAPNTSVFVGLALLTVVCLASTALSPEITNIQPGALRSLVPNVVVPPAARREFGAVVPVIAAIWMLAGLSGGFAPALVRSAFDVDSGFLNGLAGFIAPATSAVTGLAIARFEVRRSMTIGICASIAGAIGIASGVAAGCLVLMFLALAVAGIGFGAAFTASLRAVFPLVGSHQRAGLVAGIYVVSYTAFGLPVVAVAQLAAILGDSPAVACYAILTVLLALLSLLAQARIHHGSRRVSAAPGTNETPATDPKATHLV